MTPTEIAAHLIAQTTLTEETMAPLYKYSRAKRATGAPVSLENAVIHAAKLCEETRVELREHLVRAAKEAEQRLASLDVRGVELDGTWMYLDSRNTAEDINKRMVAARRALVNVVEAWAEVADRIVATDVDCARKAAEDRQRAVNALATRSARELCAIAKRRGVEAGPGARALAEALVDSGYREGA